MDRITAAQVFVTIVECGSLIGAADRLDMSRSMVTRYLAEMEDWVGARLLHRTTRRLGLSAAGEATLARCRQMLEMAGQMPSVQDKTQDTPHGMLRIACAQSLAQVEIVPAVAEYLRRYPRTAVDLLIGDKAVNLVEERIDLAIRITNQLDPNLIARPLGDCPSVICASPVYLCERGVPRTVDDLAQHNCLTFSYFGKSLWTFERDQIPVSVPVSGNLSANEPSVLLTAAVEGVGVALQPTYAAAPLIRRGDLVSLLTDYRPQGLGIYAIYSSRQHLSATLRTLLDFLVHWFARSAEERLSGGTD